MWKIFLGIATLIFTCGSCLTDDKSDLNDAVEWSKGPLIYVAKDHSDFACDLYKQLSSQNGNLFFSPYSISTALAMTQAGARGQTAEQMAEALRLPLPEDEVLALFKNLQDRLNDIQKKGEVKLSVANSIWPNAQYKILDSFTQLIKNDFKASVTPLDYSKTEEARGTINQWVEDKTNDKIKDIIQPGVLLPDTKLVLVNAIYFYGKWADPFLSKDTFNSTFNVTLDKGIDVPMMSGKKKCSYAELPGLQVLELPYQGNDVSMLIALPGQNHDIKETEAALSPKTLHEWRSKLAPAEVNILLPKFKVTWDDNLNDPLKAMGMTDAFDAKANFAGIDGDPHGLAIGMVLHKAFIDVKEEGTEAAASTAVVMTRAVAPMGPFFRADHPFLFLIQDTKTGDILFMGRVINPNAGGE